MRPDLDRHRRRRGGHPLHLHHDLHRRRPAGDVRLHRADGEHQREKGKHAKAAKHQRHHKQPVATTPPPTTPTITVTASPNPIVETTGGNGIQAQATLNIVKSDDDGGTSGPPRE